MGPELQAHAVRLLAISGIYLLAGILAARWPGQTEWVRGFGLMLAIWSVIDIVIGFFALRGAPPTDAAGLLRFLWINIGLDFGYAAGGSLMFLRSQKPSVNGMGAAVIVQGITLALLDLLLVVRLR